MKCFCSTSCGNLTASEAVTSDATAPRAVSFHTIPHAPPTASSPARVGAVGWGFVLRSQEGMGWRVIMRRVERERGGKTGTLEKLIAREGL